MQIAASSSRPLRKPWTIGAIQHSRPTTTDAVATNLAKLWRRFWKVPLGGESHRSVRQNASRSCRFNRFSDFDDIRHVRRQFHVNWHGCTFCHARVTTAAISGSVPMRLPLWTFGQEMFNSIALTFGGLGNGFADLVIIIDRVSGNVRNQRHIVFFSRCVLLRNNDLNAGIHTSGNVHAGWRSASRGVALPTLRVQQCRRFVLDGAQQAQNRKTCRNPRRNRNIRSLG